MSLYFILLLASISVPLALSFDKKLQFYKQVPYLFPAILVVGAIYIGFDVLLTKNGVWGFNPVYHSNFKILGLPLEEWLFFIIIPYASIFLHDSLVLYFPQLKVPHKIALGLSIFLLVLFFFLILMHHEKSYTVYIFSTGAFVLLLSFFDRAKNINRFYVTYLVILIPFLVVNAILTGSFIADEVVWYNDIENLGIRFSTIPIEDFVYGFSLLLFVLLLRSFLKQWRQWA